MKIRFAGFACLLIALLACSVCAPSLMAQEKKGQKAEKKAQTQNVQGLIKTITKASSMIMVQTSDTGTRNVMYNADTKFMYGHSNDSKPGNVSALKDQYYISCSGTTNDKGVLVASDCIYRESR